MLANMLKLWYYVCSFTLKKEKNMGKVINFVKKHSVLFTLALVVLFTFLVSSDVFAQDANTVMTVTENKSAGPFSAFLQKAAILFRQSRYALYTIAAFAFIAYAWTAIKDGKVEWEKMFYLIVGLVILGVAGWTVTYLAGGNQESILTTYEGFKDVGGGGWSNN